MPRKNPPKYTQEQLDLAIKLAVEGRSIGHILDAMYTESRDFWEYKQHNPEWTNKFVQARQEGLDYIADEMRKVAKDEPDVQRARLMVDTDKWLLSKLKPSVYGDKIDISLTQTIDISGALNEARQRALPQPVENDYINIEAIKIVSPVKKEDSD